MSPDTVLYAETGLAFGLLCGAGLAKLKKYAMHGWLQGLIVSANFILIGAAMRPSLMRYIESPGQGIEKFIVYAHASVGAIAELLGLYVVAAAGSGGSLKWLRLGNYKIWMRTALLVWLDQLF